MNSTFIRIIVSSPWRKHLGSGIALCSHYNCITIALQLHYNCIIICITIALQLHKGVPGGIRRQSKRVWRR